MTERVALYGLVVESEIPIHQNRPVADDARVDVRVRVGDPLEDQDVMPADGAVLHVERDGVGYAVHPRGDGYVFRVLGVCDFLIDADLRTVWYHPVVGGQDRGSVFVSGALLALLLALKGHPVLHASAVEIGDHAVGFVGQSGRGKSTMATLMCRDGARLITDDVLRLDDLDAQPLTRLGATELRLRKGADDLADGLEQATRRVSGDGRDVVGMPDGARDRLPLAALVVPTPTRDGSPLAIERITGSRAVMTLLSYPRLLGWRDPVIVQRTFAQTAVIAAGVPLFAAFVPWGPPFSPGIARAVRDAVEEAASVGGS